MKFAQMAGKLSALMMMDFHTKSKYFRMLFGLCLNAGNSNARDLGFEMFFLSEQV
jgi:hypothetical protein